MVYQRIHKSSLWDHPSQEKSSQFDPRPFAVQAQPESRRPPTQEEIERAKAQPNLLEIVIRNSQATQTTESQAPVQSNTIQAKSDTSGDRPDSSQTHIPVIKPISTPTIQRFKRPLNPNMDASSKRLKTSALDVEYWIHAAVKPETPAPKVKAEDVNVGTVWISDKRRLTAQEPMQGDHLVAWSAMVEFWSKHLTGMTLLQALAQLKEWLLKDQIYDKSVGGTAEDEAKRLNALTMIQTAIKTEDTLELKMAEFETIISLFVESNQHSKFATIGKASGGHGEANARTQLVDLNEEAGDDDEVDGVDTNNVKTAALSLLDIGKVDDPLIAEKAISAWYEMLIFTYENLYQNNKFDLLEQEVIKSKTVEQWVDAAKQRYDEKKADYLEDNGDLKAPSSTVPTDLLGKQGATLVTAELTSNQAAGTTLYQATEVTLAYVEVPDVRAATQFGSKQGAHTIAWTFKRQSLQGMFKGVNCDTALKTIKELVNSDAKDIDSTGGKEKIRKAVKNNQSKILSSIQALETKKNTLPAWKRIVEDLLGLYVEANQLMPATSYYGAYNPTGHGEAATNKVFAEATPYNKASHYEALITAAPRFVDLGILFMPLLKDASNYATYYKLGDPLNYPGERQTLQDVITKNQAAADELMESEDSATEIFAQIMQLSRFTYGAIGNLVKTLPIDVFDEVANAINTLYSYLDDDTLDRDDPLKKLLMPDTDQLLSIRVFTASMTAHKNSEEKFNHTRKNLVNRLSTAKSAIATYRLKNPKVLFEAAKRQQALTAKLVNPADYFNALYANKQAIVTKVIGHYWHHLPFYHEEFHADLKGDKNTKIRILNRIFLDPLKETDEGVGKALKSHLMGYYPTFIRAFEAAIKAKINANVDTLMPD